jgi:thiol-disulfide isomerase/thioredoxin
MEIVMTPKTAYLKILALPLLGLLLLITGQASAAAPQGPAPDFALKTAEGENARLSEYRGEVVMINFWASWCGPCIGEHPYLVELTEAYDDTDLHRFTPLFDIRLC